MDNNRQPSIFKNRDMIGIYTPDEKSINVARNWGAGYFGKLNP
jgi:hypothetical protein